ncbi:MAG: PQQ-binding-like beta-propeller repeat protein [Planctomycetales bacterium]|nr:PQQ-binding-like beta-propeller repeat protein [Planctomycetales bacterium]
MRLQFNRLVASAACLLVTHGCAAGLLAQSPATGVAFRSDQGKARAPADEITLPVDLDAADRLVWRCPLPAGHSTPCIHGQRAYLTGYRENESQMVTMAVDLAAGKLLWERVAPATRLEPYHGTSSPAAASVACDGEYLYVFFGSYGLLCYNLAGDQVWAAPLGPYQDEFGSASSPVIAGDNVILNQDHDAHNSLIAFDRRTGQVAWQVPRDEFTRSYATPVVAQIDGEMQLVVAGALTLTGYSAKTGERLWWFHGLARIVNPTPVVEGDVAYVVSWAPGGDPGERITMEDWSGAVTRYDQNGDAKLQKSELTDPEVLQRFYRIDLDQDGGLNEQEWQKQADVFRRAENSVFALQLGGRGELPADRLLWKYGRGLPYVPSPVVQDGILFMVKDSGILTSVNAETGEPIKQGRLAGRGNYYASPVAGDNKVYLCSESGVVSIVTAHGAWTLLASHDLAETMYATPSIVDGRLFLRTSQALYCFAEPAGAER